MPDSGSGTITPIIHGGPPPGLGLYLLDTPVIDLAVTLSEYCHLLKINENGFWGVMPSDGITGSNACEIWPLENRLEVLHYLEEAQEEIEKVVGYPLRARWFSEVREYDCNTFASQGHVLEAGNLLVTVMDADAGVEYVSNPGYGTIVVNSVAFNKEDIRVFYPVSLVPDAQPEIDPAYIDVDTVGGTTTIYIPRCRLVHPYYVDWEGGIPYSDDSFFLDLVDVKAYTTDPSQQGTLIWPHACRGDLCSCTCSEYTQSACLYIRDSELGAFHANPATYTDGAWNTALSTHCGYGTPTKITLRYKAGLLKGSTKTKQAMIATIRLAHSKMPIAPCECQFANRWWQRDTQIPQVMTRERLNCDFGLSNGAWQAYRWAQSMRIVRGNVL